MINLFKISPLFDRIKNKDINTKTACMKDMNDQLKVTCCPKES